MSGYPMVRESDGFERPMFAPIATLRPTVKYTDMGRVMAGGRVHRVNYAPGTHYEGRSLGWLFVADDGTLYCSPDVNEHGYHALRFVGGFANRMECVMFLRALQLTGEQSWEAAGREYVEAVAE